MSNYPSRVYRVAEPDGVREAFLRKVLDLADGRSIEEIAERLYLDELQAGAWVADIGLWKNRYIQDIARSINGLESQGRVRFEPHRPESRVSA